MLARHGDLVIYDPIDTLPEGMTLDPSGIVRSGSSDNSDHRLLGGEVWRPDDSDLAYLVVGTDGATLRHEARHTSIALPEGVYPVRPLVIATDEGVRPVED